MSILEEEVRRLALDYGGYLSEVHNGDFLLAFEEAKDALLFAVDAQEACETMPWQSRAGEISPRTPSPHIPYASPRVPYPRRDRPLSPQGEAERRTERGGGAGMAQDRLGPRPTRPFGSSAVCPRAWCRMRTRTLLAVGWPTSARC